MGKFATVHKLFVFGRAVFCKMCHKNCNSVWQRYKRTVCVNKHPKITVSNFPINIVLLNYFDQGSSCTIYVSYSSKWGSVFFAIDAIAAEQKHNVFES
jgi:hypothetical protein